MKDLRSSLQRDIDQIPYTKQDIKNDIKWGFRAVLVILALVALKFLSLKYQ